MDSSSNRNTGKLVSFILCECQQYQLNDCFKRLSRRQVIKSTNYGVTWIDVINPINLTSYGMRWKLTPIIKHCLFGSRRRSVRRSTDWDKLDNTGRQVGGNFVSPVMLPFNSKTRTYFCRRW
jgi:hypothetical protein